jgi:dipeptidyl aminopeptidase/acylaminoacyl peptidase
MQKKGYLIVFAIAFGSMATPVLGQEVNRKEVGMLVMEDVPEIPSALAERMTQFQNTRSAGIADWLPSGKGMLISTRFAETPQIHLVEKPGGARQQITFFNEPVSGGSMCPDAGRNAFLFTKDVGGNENYQIFYYDLDKGSHRMLTDGQSRNSGGRWNNQGDHFVYTSTKRNGRDNDLYIADIKAPENAEMLLETKGSWYAADWSPDDRYLSVGNYISINESYLHILDTKTKSLTAVTIGKGKEKYTMGGGAWAADGQGIFIISDEGSEFNTLRFYDIKSKKARNISANIQWDVENFDLSSDRQHAAFVTNENGMSKLYLLDPATLQYKAVDQLPVGQLGNLKWHPSEPKLAFSISTAQTSGDVFVLDTRNGDLERWTYSEVGGLKTDAFISPTLIEFNTFDKDGKKPRKIPAFYYKPSGKGPFPVVINIHGGPEGQFTPSFSPTTQFYLNEMGIAVIAPNVRGSAGYGKTYLQLDNGFKREDSVKDIGALLDWIAQQPDLDASRVAVLGGSYGGYMVLASMCHYNDRLKCGVDVVGISNFVTFLENTQDYRRDLRRVEYGDERDPKMRDFLNKISPTTNVNKISKPLFIVQGLNDPRVPASEAEQMLKAVRGNGSEAWYLLAKDEGHGFRKKGNRDFYTNAVVLFLGQHLLDGKTW